MIEKNKITKDSAPLRDFFFPDYQKTIKATSLQEAEKKLKALINKENE